MRHSLRFLPMHYDPHAFNKSVVEFSCLLAVSFFGFSWLGNEKIKVTSTRQEKNKSATYLFVDSFRASQLTKNLVNKTQKLFHDLRFYLILN